VEYVDLADPQAQAQHADLLALIEDQSLPYPLIAINGQLRLAGLAHFYRVLPLVDEMLKVQEAA